MIAQWDDHEFANDVWKGGAENHNEGEGDWRVREAAAERAHGEWMPVADTRWRHYQAGDLATIFLPETRITARDRPFDLGDILAGTGDPAAAQSAERRVGNAVVRTGQSRWSPDP